MEHRHKQETEHSQRRYKQDISNSAPAHLNQTDMKWGSW